MYGQLGQWCLLQGQPGLKPPALLLSWPLGPGLVLWGSAARSECLSPCTRRHLVIPSHQLATLDSNPSLGAGWETVPPAQLLQGSGTLTSCHSMHSSAAETWQRG